MEAEASGSVFEAAETSILGPPEPNRGRQGPPSDGSQPAEPRAGVWDAAGTRGDGGTPPVGVAASTVPSVDSAEEAQEPPPHDVTALCQDMFTKMAAYLHGELSATCTDYRLLEQLNRVTAHSYREMGEQARGSHGRLSSLTQQYACLQETLLHVDRVEQQVALLEQAAYRLDAHSKRLEAKFKKLEKR